MSLKNFLIGMAIGTLLGWVSWLFVIFNIDPETGIIAKLFFYASLFLAITGTASFLGFGIRTLFFQKGVIFSQLSVSLRQGLWFAAVLLATLMLEAADLFSIWNMLILAGLFGVLEMFFLSKEKHV